MPAYTHLILTRFNVRVDYSPEETGLDPAWLEHRFKLFEKYCYPSVHGQTNQNFKWLVFFDNKTPAVFKQKIKQYSKWENFEAIYLDERYNALVGREHALQYIDQESSYLISSRLDNDDSLRKDYIDLVQSQFNYQKQQYVLFSSGYVLNQNKLYKFRYPNNPFINLIEARDTTSACKFKTVLGLQHTELYTLSDVRYMSARAGWLQVIHNRNVSNRVRGVRYPIQALQKDFTISVENLPSKDKLPSFWIELMLTSLMVPVEKVIQKLPKKTKSSLKKLISKAS